MWGTAWLMHLLILREKYQLKTLNTRKSRDIQVSFNPEPPEREVELLIIRPWHFIDDSIQRDRK
jgi:hypothetical protein